MVSMGSRVIADEGMVLTNGDIYCTEVWLSNLDRQENWQEVDDIRKENPDE